jgi:hypothetical protein
MRTFTDAAMARTSASSFALNLAHGLKAALDGGFMLGLGSRSEQWFRRACFSFREAMEAGCLALGSMLVA